jgi:hypothetical protein
MLKHNSYFDGGVQSIGFERHGRRLTVGVVDAQQFHFDTASAERMTVVSGELWVKISGGEWRAYPSGTLFEVPANTGFDVRAELPSAYVCEFL